MNRSANNAIPYNTTGVSCLPIWPWLIQQPRNCWTMEPQHMECTGNMILDQGRKHYREALSHPNRSSVIKRRHHCLFKKAKTNNVGNLLAKTQETQREVVEGHYYNHTISPTKNNHNFLQPHHSYSCYKSIKGYTNGLLIRTLQRGYKRSRNRNLSCTQPMTKWTTTPSPLLLTNKGKYQSTPKQILFLRILLHIGSAHVRGLTKAKVSVHLILES